jgi:hypothetical protein
MVSTASCMVGYTPQYRQREKNTKEETAIMRTKLMSLVLAVAVTATTIPAAFALTSSQVGQRGDAVPPIVSPFFIAKERSNAFLTQTVKPCPNRAIPNRQGVTTCFR